MTPADLEGKTLPLDLFHFDVFVPAVNKAKLVRYGNLPDCSLPTAEYVVHRPWRDNPRCRVCGQLEFLSPTREDAEKTMAHYVAEREKGNALSALQTLVADSLPAFVSVLSRKQ